MRVALDTGSREASFSSYARVSRLLESGAKAAGIEVVLWDGGACPADLLWSPTLDYAPVDLPQVLTVHDVSPLLPDGRPGWRRWRRARRFRRRLADAARCASAFSVVSRDVLHRGSGVEPEILARGTVVPHHPDRCFVPQSKSEMEPVLQRFNLKPGYLLFSAALRRHKNWDGLLRAYAELPEALRNEHPLVLAGPEHRAGSRPRRLAEALGVAEQVKLLGAVDDTALPALYTAASWLVFPSFNEGFGLPPLEAMACGTPVLASGITAIPEVLGDAALYFDPWQVGSIAAAIGSALSDPGIRDERAQMAIAHASTYTPARTGSAMCRLLEKLALPVQ